MRKHGVILGMSCNKLIFWPGHCQHSGAKVLNELLVPPVKKLAPTLMTNKPMRKELLANNTPKYIIPARKTSLKAFPKTAPKAVTPHAAPQTNKAKQAKVPKVILKAFLAVLPCAIKESTKPLELAMVDVAPFQYLIK